MTRGFLLHGLMLHAVVSVLCGPKKTGNPTVAPQPRVLVLLGMTFMTVS